MKVLYKIIPRISLSFLHNKEFCSFTRRSKFLTAGILDALRVSKFKSDAEKGENTKPYKILSLIILIIISLSFRNLYAEQKPLSVFVSIPPQVYFVERIGGERVSVDILAGKGENPETYAPKPDLISKLKKADILFSIDVPFEKRLLEKIKNSLGKIKIIDTTKGISKRRMAGGIEDDPHVWLSPRLIKYQAGIIFEALSEADRKGKDVYAENFKSLIEDINILDNEIRNILKPVKGRTIFVLHPAFGYFADEYGLKQQALKISGKQPKGEFISFFIKKAKEENARVIFVQPQFDQKIANKIASAIDCAVITLDPLSEDYIGNLKDMAHKILSALMPPK